MQSVGMALDNSVTSARTKLAEQDVAQVCDLFLLFFIIFLFYLCQSEQEPDFNHITDARFLNGLNDKLPGLPVSVLNLCQLVMLPVRMLSTTLLKRLRSARNGNLAFLIFLKKYSPFRVGMYDSHDRFSVIFIPTDCSIAECVR